jgi:hypothetical protein
MCLKVGIQILVPTFIFNVSKKRRCCRKPIIFSDNITCKEEPVIKVED